MSAKYRLDLLTDPRKATPEIKARPSVHTLESYTNPDFAAFDMSIPDVQRAEVFLREFRQFEQLVVFTNAPFLAKPEKREPEQVKTDLPYLDGKIAGGLLGKAQFVGAVRPDFFMAPAK